MRWKLDERNFSLNAMRFAILVGAIQSEGDWSAHMVPAETDRVVTNRNWAQECLWKAKQDRQGRQEA